MVRVTLLLVLVGLLVTPVVAEDDGARALLVQHLESIGGDAALAKIEGVRSTYDGSYGGESYTSEVIWVRPHRVTFKLEAGAFTGRMGVDKDVAWSAFMAPVARVRGPTRESLMDWRHHYEIFLVRPLLSAKGVKIARGPSEKKGDMTLEHVLLTYPGDKNYDLGLHIDGGKSTLLSVKGDMTSPDGRKGTFRMDLSDHKTFAGITWPTKTHYRSFIAGKKFEDMTEMLTSLEWNPEVTDATFARPKLTIPLDVKSVKEAPAVTGLRMIHAGSPRTMGKTMLRLRRLCFDRGYMAMGAVMATFLDDGTEPEKKKGIEILLPVQIPGETPKDLPRGVTVVTRPAIKVASVTCRGPYGMTDAEAMGALLKWMGEKKHEMVGPPRVLFLHDPAGTEPEDQVAEVQIPVK